MVMNAHEKGGIAWRKVDRSRSKEPFPEHASEVSVEEVDGEWDQRRRELVADGGFFDAQGYVTKAGQERLMKSNWTMKEVLQMEDMQRNHVAEVTVVRNPSRESEGPAMSARGRSETFARASSASESALAQRGIEEVEARQKREDELRRLGERRSVGVKAFMTAMDAGLDDATALLRKREAEERYDRDAQRARNERAASRG